MRNQVQKVLCGAMALFAVSAGAVTVTPRTFNGVARFMAGMDPGEDGYELLTSTPAWIDHKSFFDKNWADLSKKRLEPAGAWRTADVKPDAALKTVFYPFSGPDFLNAYLFFPDADTYVFYSLEAPGVAPAVLELSPLDSTNLLSDIRNSLDDIFLRQYFITKRMMKELRTPVLRGNAPLLMVFMARMDLDVLSLDHVRLDSQGDVYVATSTATGALAKRAAKNPIPGVKITFQKNGGKIQTLYYFSVDVSDKALAAHPEFLAYLKGVGRGITFMKSASYLLHGSNFSKIRGSILDSAQYLLQDDSGLPYRFFGKEGWDVVLYGRYTNAIKDFNGTIQKDLDEAYKTQSPRPLPFTFGYHWYDKHSNVQIAVRKQ